jgi:predicted deacetylase
MSARYLLRLDDACQTMDRRRWGLLEAVLDRHAVRPIVAVIPDNQDPALMIEAPDPAFWDKVRSWQAKGWTLGMHGHTHAMHPVSEPHLVPFYERSEFVGLDLAAQRSKIRAAWQHFQAEGVTPQVWVAPSHSFDALTLEALREETPIGIVSDGIAFDAYFEHGFHWIPQQLWRLAPRRAGLWTVCLHPSAMSEQAIAALDHALQREFRGRVIGTAQVRLRRRAKPPLGRLYHAYFWWRWRRSPQAAALREATRC